MRRAPRLVGLVQVAALSFFVTGCDLGVFDWIDVFFGDGKDICFLRRWPSRCEGDVLVACPGGWMTIDAKMHRTDCRETDEYCLTLDHYGEARSFCMDSKGACDVASFSSVCEPYGEQFGRMTVCDRGQIFATGVQCSVSSGPSQSMPLPLDTP